MKIHIIIAPTCFSLRPSSELVLRLAKVTLSLKHSVKLHRILCGDVAACREMVCMLFVAHTDQSAQQTAHMPFHDMLPHLHTIYDDLILLNVLTEV
jgi:hypothetical protein